ncbi:hypothetical protein AHMF7605_23035 [Adhaeribacter arboris]|uniref:Uncharacterized protein n=1 Tax=Adhaeribacter arboris TaxID=2072846 RepID=A0A2T2YKY6_9BACT|nr:hypothetical protein [Adhaeribacter arboris]PSR56172.1 hypothetical protein AHMF7605_23035 [Adhaeribacter arboris]
MDILFTEREEYKIRESIGTVRARIKAIAEKKWFEYSDNLTGSFKSNDTFEFTTFFNFMIIGSGSFGSKPAYLNGKLKQEENGTSILVKCRPNIVLIFFFYIITILFLGELFGIDTFLEVPKGLVLILLPFFNFILYFEMRRATRRLVNKFESIIQVNNKNNYLQH